MPADGEEPQTECARIQVQLQKADGLKAKGNAALKSRGSWAVGNLYSLWTEECQKCRMRSR